MYRSITIWAFFVLTLSGLQAQSYNDWVEKAMKAIDNKDWAEAVVCFKSALRVEPANSQNAILLSNMGTAQREMGKPREAIESYTHALLFAPKSVTLLLNRAAALLQTDSIGAAGRDYDRAIELDARCIEGLNSRALLRLSLKDTAGARMDWERVLALKPFHFGAKSGMALYYKLRGQFAESEKIYNSLLEIEPLNRELLMHRAELFYMSGKANRALTDANKLLEADKTDSYAFMLRGKIYVALFERKLAFFDFETARKMGHDPREVSAWLRKVK